MIYKQQLVYTFSLDGDILYLYTTRLHSASAKFNSCPGNLTSLQLARCLLVAIVMYPTVLMNPFPVCSY